MLQFSRPFDVVVPLAPILLKFGSHGSCAVVPELMNVCRILLLTSLLSLLGCGRGAVPDRDYEFRIVSESDPGVPLSNVHLERDEVFIATTSSSGVAEFTIRGGEGERVPLAPVCPDGYAPEEPSVTAVLRSYEGERVPELLVRCTAERSRLAVVVRVENGAHLPVRHRSRTLAITDDEGVAHVLLEGKPGDTVELSLNTEKQPRIKPSNPSARFTLAAANDVALFEQKFLVERPKKTFRARLGKDESRPVRIR